MRRRRQPPASHGGRKNIDQLASSAVATFFLAPARSRSMTERQPLLRSARCFIMQAVIFGMFGISELQRRKASPVHICCASALKAKLEVDESADSEAARARTKPAWRTVLVKDAVILGSHWLGSAGPFLMRVCSAPPPDRTV